MQLVKIFKFTGLFRAGRKMDTPMGSFLRFVNSYKDKTGRISPSGKSQSQANNLPYIPTLDPVYYDLTLSHLNYSGPLASQVFKNKAFQIIPSVSHEDFPGLPWYLSDFRYGQDENSDEFALIQNGPSFSGSDRGSFFNFNSINFCPQGNHSSCVINNKLYLCDYVDYRKYSDAAIAALPDPTLRAVRSNLLRFDGMRIAKAGLPTPWPHHPITNGGTSRLRVVYMTMGLDAEPILSNYIEYQVTPTSNTIATRFGNYSPGLVPVPDAVGVAGCYFPKTRQPGDSLSGDTFVNNYDLSSMYIDSSVMPTYAAGVLEIRVMTGEEQQVPGDWFMVIPQTPSINAVYDAFYFKLSGFNANNALKPQFFSKIKGFNGYTSTWEDIDLADGAPRGYVDMTAFLTDLKTSIALSNTYMIVSISNSAGTTDYQVTSILPVVWSFDKELGVSTLPMSFARPRLGFLTSFFKDWYEITSVKVPFPPVIGITNFSNLLIGYDEDVLYFSDVSYGGSTEMTSGVANLIPPGSEFGKIVGCCGAENLLLIGRERKNYILTGEITTGNVTIVECDVAIPGPANAKAMSNAFADQIVFMNRTGIYSVGQGGSIVDLSKDIKDLFLQDKATHGCLFDRSIFKTGRPAFDGAIFKIVLDDLRGFILFLTGQRNSVTKDVDQSNILVYDTNDGTWYEWTTPTNCSSIEVVEGQVYFFCGGSIFIESNSNPEQILTFNPLTMGEPSLEQHPSQVKLYASMGVQEIKLKSQNDWKPALVTDEAWIPEAGAYIHKKRLSSSKALATSITLEGQNNGIYLEGMEIEMELIQQGMKK